MGSLLPGQGSQHRPPHVRGQQGGLGSRPPVQVPQGHAPGDELPRAKVHGDRKIPVHLAGDYFLQPRRSGGAAQGVPVKGEQQQKSTAYFPREIRPEDNDAVNLVLFFFVLAGLTKNQPNSQKKVVFFRVQRARDRASSATCAGSQARAKFRPLFFTHGQIECACGVL